MPSTVFEASTAPIISSQFDPLDKISLVIL
ncbi:hypothetical protein Xhom_02605 [Xenorhabdus hominickii]|uniref:Uncharacterized protein n=1 Tax=Xenorhabdus hominickii TaxID=351679 RepID=A0A2G0Q605_XENHO|nr:hypothetical protein Xhom_02605 [Xenorhabdus hominickii]